MLLLVWVFVFVFNVIHQCFGWRWTVRVLVWVWWCGRSLEKEGIATLRLGMCINVNSYCKYWIKKNLFLYIHSSIYTHTYELTVYLHFDFTLIKPWQGLLGYDKTSNPKYLGQCKIQNIVLYCIVFVFRHLSFIFLPSPFVH